MRNDPRVALLERAFGPDATPKRQLRRVSRLFTEERHPEGTVLIAEQGHADAAYLIVDGTAEVSVAGKPVARLERGEFVGEMALLDGGLRSATVTALTDLHVLAVPRERFVALRDQPVAMDRITAGLARRARPKARATRSKKGRGQPPATGDPEAWRAVLEASRLQRRRRRRRRIGATVAGVLVLLLIAGAGIRVLADRATPISVDEAVARFREQVPDTTGAQEVPDAAGGASAAGGPAVAGAGDDTSGSRGADAARAPAGSGAAPIAATSTEDAARRLPSAGVYVYDTSGFEEVSILGGSRHTYPKRTTVTITHSACGMDVRWDGIEERWDRWATCVDGPAIELHEFRTYHEFFEQADLKAYECVETMMRPASDQPGTAFTGRCQTEDARAELTGTVVSVEDMTIGGRTVSAVRIRLDEVLTGATDGTRTSESWYAADTGLLLRRTSTTDANAKATFGYTHYREELKLQIVSLDARR